MPARNTFAALIFLAAPLATLSPAHAASADLTIVTRDDATEQAIQSAFVQGFTAITGKPVQQLLWDGGADALRAQAKTPNDPWDLVMVNPEELNVGCSEGLLEKLDWSAIGGKDHYQSQAVSDCGLGALVSTTALAWDKDKLPVVPTWADFWDVAKYPGKRGLHKGVRGSLEFALMADGVAPGDVYKILSTADGLDRAFHKLDQLKPYIVWWSTEAQAARILSSGDVLMTSAPSGQIATLAEREHKNFGLQFAGSLYQVDSWAIMKASPNLRTAQQFLYFSGLPALQARLLRNSGNGGLVKGIDDGLPPALVALSPSAPANLTAGLRIDTGFWHDNLPKLRQRFDAWLGQQK